MTSNGDDGDTPEVENIVQPNEKRVRFSLCEDPGVQHVFKTVHNPRRKSNLNKQNMDIPEAIDMGDPGGDRKRGSSSSSSTDQDRDRKVMLLEKEKKKQDEDPWATQDVVIVENSIPEKSWSELTTKGKIFRVLIGIGKTLALLALLYFFVCSLDLLSVGFRLVGGRTAGEIFRRSEILQNPVVGVMIGILTTVLVQSSSTSTSIIVGMVAAGFLEVKVAIPMIMGANIGTSITNTIVSFTQAGDRNQFRRAFAGATVLDMFNWITVIVLLIVEILTGYLFHLSQAVMDGLVPDTNSGGEIQLLSVITKPFVNLIVQLDEAVLECWSTVNCTDADSASLIKEYCSSATSTVELIQRVVDINGNEIINEKEIVVHETQLKCDFLFAGTPLNDTVAGVIILISALIVLCTCLILIVKVLNSVLQGQISVVINKTLNADIPYVPWITGYIAILVGAIMTFLVQSSSVFTSALTPLVGLGVLSLERVYPLTLGSNIGTTTTAIIASMAVEGKLFKPSMQIALCHFFFNITGILLFYPIPITRLPIRMAKFLGDTTAEYRWFAIVYMVVMFVILPMVTIGLSFAGPVYVIVFVSIIAVLLCAIGLVNLIQNLRPTLLPAFMRTWDWLPKPLRSLQPYDDLFSKCNCCKGLKEKNVDTPEDKENFIFYPASKMKLSTNNNNRNSVNEGNTDFGYSNGNTNSIGNGYNDYNFSNGHAGNGNGFISNGHVSNGNNGFISNNGSAGNVNNGFNPSNGHGRNGNHGSNSNNGRAGHVNSDLNYRNSYTGNGDNGFNSNNDPTRHTNNGLISSDSHTENSNNGFNSNSDHSGDDSNGFSQNRMYQHQVSRESDIE